MALIPFQQYVVISKRQAQQWSVSKVALSFPVRLASREFGSASTQGSCLEAPQVIACALDPLRCTLLDRDDCGGVSPRTGAALSFCCPLSVPDRRL